MNESGETSLIRACRNGHVDVIKLLLVRGAEVDRARNDGATPLGLACRYGHDDVEQLLLANGARVNEAGEDSDDDYDY